MNSQPGQWISANSAILTNAGSLVGTTLITSALGFVYWWLAARLFPPVAVGLASSSISAMMLLGNMGVLGLGTYLIGELPRQPGKAGSLISTSLLVAGAASGGLGLLFAVVAPRLSTEFEPLAHGLGNITLIASGVALTATSTVLDQALIGLLRGGLQWARNALFAAAKLVALLIVGLWFSDNLGLAIYATWVAGILVSLVILAGIIAFRGIRIAYRPRLELIRGLGPAALGHHGLNMALQAPGLALPIVVTVTLSASANAHYYAAWMVAGFAYVGPTALATVLYAVVSAVPTSLTDRIRFTLSLSLLIGGLASLTLFISARFVLNLFGTEYAEQAQWPLRTLSLGVFPLIVKVHYVAICRVFKRITRTARLLAAAALFEMVLAVVGTSIAGLLGLTIGWLIAMCCEAALMIPTVYATANGNPNSTKMVEGVPSEGVRS